MKLIVSSYNTDEFALSYLDVDIKRKTYQILDQKKLNEPTFFVKIDDFIVSYTKEPLALVSYQIKGNSLIELSRMSIPGESLTHLVYSKKHKRIYGASYFDGAYMKIDFDGGFFSNLIYIKDIHFPSKCHCVYLSEDEEKVYIINIIGDMIYRCNKDLNLEKRIILPKKTGPRHGMMYDGYTYVVSEYSNEVLVLDKEEKLLQVISTLNHIDVESYGATLLVRNHHLYVSNRGLEKITVYELKNHLLIYQTMFDVYGKHSRHMILDDSKKYIISLNKNSNNISFIDVEDGTLIMKIPYPNVSCAITF